MQPISTARTWSNFFILSNPTLALSINHSKVQIKFTKFEDFFSINCLNLDSVFNVYNVFINKYPQQLHNFASCQFG